MCGRKDPQPVSWQSLLDSGHLLTLQVLTEAKDSFKTKHVLTPHKHTHTHTHTHTQTRRLKALLSSYEDSLQPLIPQELAAIDPPSLDMHIKTASPFFVCRNKGRVIIFWRRRPDGGRERREEEREKERNRGRKRGR